MFEIFVIVYEEREHFEGKKITNNSVNFFLFNVLWKKLKQRFRNMHISLYKKQKNLKLKKLLTIHFII